MHLLIKKKIFFQNIKVEKSISDYKYLNYYQYIKTWKVLSIFLWLYLSRKNVKLMNVLNIYCNLLHSSEEQSWVSWQIRNKVSQEDQWYKLYCYQSLGVNILRKKSYNFLSKV